MRIVKSFRILPLFILGLALFAQDDQARREYFARDAQRNQLWQNGRYDQAVVILEEMSRNAAWNRDRNLRINTLYNLACGYSLLGRKEDAVKVLREAVQLGYSNVQHVRTDTDFDNIRNEPGYRDIVAAMDRHARFWDSPTFSTPFSESLTEAEKIAGLSRFWSEVKYNFPFFDKLPDLDWDALYLTWIQKVRETRDTTEYYRALTQLCARLNDTHTYIIPPRPVAEKFQFRPALQSRLLEGKVIVTAVDDRTLSSAGVVPGVEIVSVDGVPLEEHVQKTVLPYIGASTPQGLEDAAYNVWLLAGARGSLTTVAFRDASGAAFERSLVKNANLYPSGGSAWRFEMLEGRIAYVKLNTFMAPEVVKEFEAAFDKIQSSDFLILDLRVNRGGNSGNGIAILKFLLDKPFRDTQCRTRAYRAAWRSWGTNQDWEEDQIFLTPPGTKIYAKPIIVLTSAQTGSASEDFLAGLDSARRVTIIGETTNGSTGNPLMITLPGGGRAAICTRYCTYPDGREFNGLASSRKSRSGPRSPAFAPAGTPYWRRPWSTSKKCEIRNRVRTSAFRRQ